jgi:glutamine cyclotransferase
MAIFNDQAIPQGKPDLANEVQYKYRLVNVFPHDPSAFTQGLVYENGVLYEGTGQYGESSLRKVDLKTGTVLERVDLPVEYFGEGITIYKDKIIQLTWRSFTGFVYDKSNLFSFESFTYDSEGWGITCDGKRLIVSDGTSTLRFLNPEKYTEIGKIEIKHGLRSVKYLNELEYINGYIFANVLPSDSIAIIHPQSGDVKGWVDLSGLLSPAERRYPIDVLNGIAYDAVNDRFFVTGKNWPKLFEIKIISFEK